MPESRRHLLNFVFGLVLVMACAGRHASADAVGLAPGGHDSGTITFDPGFGSPVSVSGCLPLGFARTISNGPGGASSSAVAGIFPVVFPSAFGLAFTGGTGVSQFAPVSTDVAPATLTIGFNVDFALDASGFGPPVYEGYFFSLAGNVGHAPGDFVSLQVDATFTEISHGESTVIGPGIHQTIFYDSTPGPFRAIAFGIFPTSPTMLAPDAVVNISGDVVFAAKDNGQGASSVEAESAGVTTPEPAMLFPVVVFVLALAGTRSRKVRQIVLEPSDFS